MKRLVLLLIFFFLPTAATATPIEAGVLLSLGSHADGNQAPPAYGLRLDGLNGDITTEFTFDFDNVNSDMTLFYDDVAGTIQISGVTWGGEDIGDVYAGGGSLWAVDMIDVAGSHSYSFQCVDSHRGEDRACYGWVNHSRTDLDEHVYSSDWLFTVDSAPVPEPSAALLFGLGAVVCASSTRRRESR